MHELFSEINQYTGRNIQYLAEIDALDICGAGKIYAKYITKFSSESVKGYLIPQIVADRVKDSDRLLLQLYRGFKQSEEYIAKPGESSPAHIYVRYDNAFKRLKPRRLANDLMEFAYNPRDAFYLPFTMRMLSSWKIEEMRDLLIRYACGNDLNIFGTERGNTDDTKSCPPIEFMKRELKFTAIDGLKYFPSPEVVALIKSFIDSDDKDIQTAAKQTLKTLR